MCMHMSHYVCSYYAEVSDLFDVHYQLLNVAHNWRGVGKALRLHPDLLNRIESNRSDCAARLEEVLTEWLKKAYDTARFGAPSWHLLVAAVAHPAGGKDRALAEKIAARHNGRCLETDCILSVPHTASSLSQHSGSSSPFSLLNNLIAGHTLSYSFITTPSVTS